MNKTLKKKYESEKNTKNENIVIINPCQNFSFKKIPYENQKKKNLNYLNKKFYYKKIKIKKEKKNFLKKKKKIFKKKKIKK